ncbi:hypothetical protein ACLOJK_001298 [Asimina triloba]
MASTSKPHPSLHNFSLPPLKWGKQRLLRCMKTNPHRRTPSTAPDCRSLPSDAESVDHTSPNRSASFHTPATPSPREKSRDLPTDDGIEEVRAKLMDHLRTAADRMSYKVPEGGEEESTAAEALNLRPWNLRTRRATCKAPADNGGGGGGGARPVWGSLRSKGLVVAGEVQDVEKEEEEKKSKKFLISLARDEIVEDFFIMTGSKPARRPKKRARIVQRQVDAVFPAWSTLDFTEMATGKFHEHPNHVSHIMDGLIYS